MKRAIYLLIIVFLYGCSKNEGGKLVCSMTYNLTSQTSELIKKKSLSISKAYSTNDRYTQFGDYIASITPSVFIIKFLDLRLCSAWENQMNNLAIIDNNDFSWSSTERIADFSNNATVNMNISGTIKKDLEMIYLVSVPMFYYQEFELPEQYYSFNVDSGLNNLTYLSFGGNNIDYPTANGGIGGIKEGCLVKGSNSPLTAPIFDGNWTGFDGNFPEIPHITVFGNTDSTFIFSSDGISKDDPMGCAEVIIRSNKFNSIKLQAIPEGETKTITGVMTFDTNGLIQIYAGKDNIPYTSDDIFVYVPRYWERISVSLNSY
jgi:hypothetical protein